MLVSLFVVLPMKMMLGLDPYEKNQNDILRMRFFSVKKQQQMIKLNIVSDSV
jgi:hypothetical protein